jgi:hypothetical protein
MTFVTNKRFIYLDIKRQLLKLLEDGYVELNAVDKYGEYKVKVFSRDPILKSIGEASKSIPCITVFRQADDEESQFLGEAYDEEDADLGNYRKGRLFEESFELKVWAFTPILRDDLYYDLKCIIVAGMQRYLYNLELEDSGEEVHPFGEGGASTVVLAEGHDENTINEIQGHPIFTASLIVRVLNSMQWQDTTEWPIIVNHTPNEGEVGLNVISTFD